MTQRYRKMHKCTYISVINYRCQSTAILRLSWSSSECGVNTSLPHWLKAAHLDPDLLNELLASARNSWFQQMPKVGYNRVTVRQQLRRRSDVKVLQQQNALSRALEEIFKSCICQTLLRCKISVRPFPS